MKRITSVVASSCLAVTAFGGFANAAFAATVVSADATSVKYVIPYTGTPTWTRVYIDTNRSAASGYASNGIGAEYLIENGRLYRHSGTNGGWGWTAVKSVSSVVAGGTATVTVAKADIGSTAAIDSITQTDAPSTFSAKITTALTATSPAQPTTSTASLDGLTIKYVIPYSSTPTWTRVYIDADRSPTSGFRTSSIGGDYLIENGVLFRYAGSNGAWGWTRIKSVPFTLGSGSAVVSVGIADIGAPPSIDSITQTDAPTKISPKLTTSTSGAPAPAPVPTPTPTPAPTPTPPPSTSTVVVDYFGDSTAHGDIGGTPYQVAQTPSMVMDANLPTNYVVRNEAVGGASVLELLEGRDGVHAPWPTTVARSTAKYIIMNYSINDSYEPGTTVTSYKASYAKVIDIARAAGKIVILQTSNPTSDNQKTLSFVTAMKQVAAEKNVQVIDQYTYLMQYMAANRLGIYQITNDGVHPNQATYILEGQYAAKRFKEIIGLP